MPFKITKNKELICFNSDKDFEDYKMPVVMPKIHTYYEYHKLYH